MVTVIWKTIRYSSIFSIKFFFEKSINSNVAPRFFALALLMFQWIVKTLKLWSNFFESQSDFFFFFFFFPKNFLDFKLGMIKKPSIINCNYNSWSYASVVLYDSGVTFLGERKYVNFCLLCFG